MITLVGLGPGDISGLSLGAKQALEAASELHRAHRGRLFLRTERHPVVATLQTWDLAFETFDSLYERAADFEAVYSGIAERVLAAAALPVENGAPDHLPVNRMPVTYAVPGHPLFAEDSVRRIREAAQAAAIPVRIVSSGSFVDAVLTALEVDLAEGCDVRDALSLPESDAVDRQGLRLPARPDTARGLLLYQVFDVASASRTKLALMRDYPDDWEIALVRWAGVPEQEEIRKIPLFRLDRERVDYLTSVYVPPLPPSTRRPRFPELVGIMARLRAPDGCPWDREQTHRTLRRYFIEETYEVIEAIEADDPDLLCEELGDALLQVVFHAQLMAETGTFDIDDVVAGIVQKLIRRHPHVFGEIAVADSAEVLRNWERIKREEKQETEHKRRDSVLDGVPKGLPALMQAMEISKRAVKVGFEWGSFAEVLSKLEEEWAELKSELDASSPDPERVAAEIGDLLFTMVQVARWNRIDPEEALRHMVARFERRFRYIERSALQSGRRLEELSLAEMDALWEQAKRQDSLPA